MMCINIIYICVQILIQYVFHNVFKRKKKNKEKVEIASLPQSRVTHTYASHTRMPDNIL